MIVPFALLCEELRPVIKVPPKQCSLGSGRDHLNSYVFMFTKTKSWYNFDYVTRSDNHVRMHGFIIESIYKGIIMLISLKLMVDLED